MSVIGGRMVDSVVVMSIARVENVVDFGCCVSTCHACSNVAICLWIPCRLHALDICGKLLSVERCLCRTSKH
jgi:hypothetical protein